MKVSYEIIGERDGRIEFDGGERILNFDYSNFEKKIKRELIEALLGGKIKCSNIERKGWKKILIDIRFMQRIPNKEKLEVLNELVSKLQQEVIKIY